MLLDYCDTRTETKGIIITCGKRRPMASFQDTVLLWRYQGQNTWKTVVGFWAKATVESVLMIGVPVGVFTVALTALAEVSFGSVPLVNETQNPRLIGWIVLTAGGWVQLRCLFADGVDVKSLVARSREGPAQDTGNTDTAENAESLEEAQKDTKQ